jgi:hypothetical protein
MPHVAEAETVGNVEGNMGGAIMRGAVAPPESQTTSRRKGARRNLGDLLSPAAASAVAGRAGKLGRASPTRVARGVGRLRSTEEASNKADPVGGGERGGKARRDACPGHSAGFGMSPERRAYGPEVNGPPKPRTPVAFDLRQEPGAGKPHAGICGGGAGHSAPLPDQLPLIAM